MLDKVGGSAGFENWVTSDEADSMMDTWNAQYEKEWENPGPEVEDFAPIEVSSTAEATSGSTNLAQVEMPIFCKTLTGKTFGL